MANVNKTRKPYASPNMVPFGTLAAITAGGQNGPYCDAFNMISFETNPFYQNNGGCATM